MGFRSSRPASILEKSRMSFSRFEQRVRRQPSRFQVFALFRRKLGREHQVGHANDAVHRSADLVAHVGQEFAL